MLKSLRLSCQPKEAKLDAKIRFDLTTLNGAGEDIGESGVAALGLCYAPVYDIVWSPDGGPEQRSQVIGKGGSLNDPNPGYSLGDIKDINIGSSAWIFTQGYGFMAHHMAKEGAGAGWLRVKAYVGELASPTVEVRIG